MAEPIPTAADLIAQRQYAVRMRVVGDNAFDIPGLWDMMAGSGLATTATEAWPAGSKTPVRLQGPVAPKQITLSRVFAPDRDKPMLTQLRELANQIRLDVSRQELRRDGSAWGEPTVWFDCMLVEVNDAATDSASGEASRIEVVLAPAGIR